MRKLVLGIFIGLLVGLSVGVIVAQPFVQWQKSEVLPVVMVEPLGADFIAKDGTRLQGTWRKDQVIPMCLVRANLHDFSPKDGVYSSANSWSKAQVKPFVSVGYNPSVAQFVPIN